jgi:hypothetical protein
VVDRIAQALLDGLGEQLWHVRAHVPHLRLGR